MISLDFAGQWNGVSMERRTEVKDFQHKEPVEGSAIIELFNEKNKCVYKADNVSVIDGKLEHTVSDTGRMTTGMYDVILRIRCMERRWKSLKMPSDMKSVL